MSGIGIETKEELVVTIIVIYNCPILGSVIEHVLITLEGHWIKNSVPFTIPNFSKKEDEFASSLLDFNIWMAIVSDEDGFDSLDDQLLGVFGVGGIS